MIRRKALACLLSAAMAPSLGSALARPSSAPSWRTEGQRIWIASPDGRLKLRVYASARATSRPVLVLYVHGDLGPDDGHFQLAQTIAHVSDNAVAVAVTRPGYTDAEGDTSSGLKAYAIGDNYTPRVVEDIDAAVRQLKSRFHARAVVLIGHSGGGAIVADLLGLHPEDADAAVLVACNCDPREFMTRFMREHPGLPKGLRNPSLPPLDLAAQVRRRMHVRMVIGEKDDVVRLPASRAYAAALKAHGVDVQLTIVPGEGHVSVLGAQPTRQAVADVLRMEGAAVHPPTQAAPPR